mgnify:CR=1 FL=1
MNLQVRRLFYIVTGKLKTPKGRKNIRAVLFDIDGTLVRFNGAGKRALKKAAIEVYGTAGMMDAVHFQGKTDPLIIYESLEPVGINRETIDRKMGRLKESHFFHLDHQIKGAEAELLPGVRELLDLLKNSPAVITGLLTGNFHGGALRKLNVFGLMDYFAFGVFSDDTPHRDEMPPIARERIMELYSMEIDFVDMFIIGDTVYDIRCGKNSGAVTIAVGTGWTDPQALLNEEPDYYFDDLSDTEMMAEILLG